MDELEKLWKSTGEAHNQIHSAYCALLQVAADVKYLHPNLHDKLRKVAWSIDLANQTIKGNTVEMVNLSIRNQEQASANMLSAMLGKVS